MASTITPDDVSDAANVPEATYTRRRGRVFTWFDRRAGINSLLTEALDEPIPGGARLAYVFGSGLLFLFLSQIITGVSLALYYVPSADHAHTTIAYITKEVMAGSFLRSLHSYGSSAMVIVLLMHLTQTFLYGSYKGRRELLWVSGCLLFALVIGMAFTGYLLPWDMKAYFATTVGTNISGEAPLVGEGIKRLMRGGNDMGTLTLSRFFVAHVFLIPAAIFAFVALHVYLFRKAGAAGPISEHPIAPKQKTERFYPRQILMDMGFGLALIAALGILAYVVPVDLGPKANPADTQYVPRPEWYYLPVFQWLKYWQGSRAVIGILVIPLIVIGLFVGLPFMDRRLERRPWKRPLAVGVFAIVFLSLIVLGTLSYVGDHRDPGIAEQLAKQREETEEFMRAPFEPETSGSSLAAANAALADPVATQGKAVYEAQSCNACHGDGGIGTPAGPKLIGIGAKFPGDKLAALLKQPTDKMTSGGMTALELTDQEMKGLIAYLNRLK
jgi:ubiquinol-cytochrome c reductase cytochrome b subunit